MHSEKKKIKEKKGKSRLIAGHTSLTRNSQYKNHLMTELTVQSLNTQEY